MAAIIDGKAFAAKLRENISQQVAAIKHHGITPGLAVVVVGNDPASSLYVKNKSKQSSAVGCASFEYRLGATTSERELLTLIEQLNDDEQVHGILVQLPLPGHIDAKTVIDSIRPEKDVDGFSALNAGRLAIGEKALIPCTPLGCLLLLKDYFNDDLSGKHAMVIGRSNIVGKPMASLLLQEHATVTISHSKTRDIASLCCRADIVIAAVGRPQMVKANWIKPGAVVIDVGINRIEVDGIKRLVGDVDFAEVSTVAAAITPVPGGVGPMTIACLLNNTLQAARQQNGLSNC